MTAIREEFEQAEPGTLIATSRLLCHGPRAAVDQSLSRLVRAGEITRAARGLHYVPKVSRLVGSVPPEPRAVAEALAESRGELIAVHGAEAARQLGLTTQAPLSPIFLTSGRTRTVQLGQFQVQLRHASPKQLALSGTPAGEALRAMRYLGPKQVNSEVIAKVKSALPLSEYERLRAETSVMPYWLSDKFYRFEHSRPKASMDQEVSEQALV
jgi:hypothetical protein